MQNESQGNALVNPNQTWFPHVLQVRKIDGVLVMDIVSDKEPAVGEKFVNANGVGHTVLSIVKSRKAKGDWSGKFWNKVKPTWYRCAC